MNFAKPANDINQQIAFLKQKGLTIEDDNYAAQHLANISYYRLKAYLISFRNYGDPNNTYMPWANFKKVVNLYVFDRELRFISLNAIERIEVALRCQISYEYSIRHGNNWYEDPSLYNNSFVQNGKFKDLMNKVHLELKRTKEVFIQHYYQKYKTPKNPPSWMVIEVLSLGQLSIMFKNLHANDSKKAIANYFGVSPTILESWIEHLAYIRNLCAHHSRLWNRTLTITPTIPKKPKYTWITIPPAKTDKVYISLCIMAYMLNIISPKSYFVGQVKTLIHKFPNIDIKAAGFEKNWKKDPFWRGIHIPITYKGRIVFFKCKNILYASIGLI